MAKSPLPLLLPQIHQPAIDLPCKTAENKEDFWRTFSFEEISDAQEELTGADKKFIEICGHLTL